MKGVGVTKRIVASDLQDRVEKQAHGVKKRDVRKYRVRLAMKHKLREEYLCRRVVTVGVAEGHQEGEIEVKESKN